MSYDPYMQAPNVAASGTDVDAGLQGFMRSVYNTMSIGLGVSGVVAIAFMSSPAVMATIGGNPLLFWAILVSPMIFSMGAFTQSRIARWPASKLKGLFYAYAGVMGVWLSVVMAQFTPDSIARVFFISAGMFAAVSIYGYVTKRDLTSLGSFATMGATGIFLAIVGSLVAGFIFGASISPMIHFVISIGAVVVFTAMAAWMTQSLKETYSHSQHIEANDKMAVLGAYMLYGCFINIFYFLLTLLGNRE